MKDTVGVVIEDGHHIHRLIFSLAMRTFPISTRNLLPENKEAKKLDKKLYTCSTIMFYWGVDKEYPQIAHHNVFLGGDYKASFDQIFNDHTSARGALVLRPCACAHRQGRRAKWAGYTLCSRAGRASRRTLRAGLGGLVDRARETVFTRLAKEMGADDLKEHIKFEIVYQPKVWKERFNLEKGAAFGLSHNFWQVGYLRPQNRHKQYKNLYFTGASTHPGTGLADRPAIRPADHRTHPERSRYNSCTKPERCCRSRSRIPTGKA